MNSITYNVEVHMLWKRYQQWKKTSRLDNGGEQEYEDIRKEVARYHNLDKEGKLCNVNSLKILCVMNRIMQGVPTHRFGLNFEIDE